jgi:HAE1 family hydrophobic/amphiphilic exporter-1
VERMSEMGQRIEEKLRPYWDFNVADLKNKPRDFVGIDDFFYVANDNSVFMGLRAYDGNLAHAMIPLIREEFKEEFPGTFFNVSQTSLFGRGMSGGRSIDVEIVGPDLETLVMIGGKILGEVRKRFPETTQVRPRPSLDLANPELHVVRKPEQGTELGINNVELGFVVSTLVDGAYIADYFHGGEKLDLVLRGNDSYSGHSQDLESEYIATRNARTPVRLDALADVRMSAGPDQILRRERQRAVTIEVTPSPEISLEAAINRLQNDIILPLELDGTISTDYQVNLSGTADKLVQTWNALRWNFLLALLITYLLMAALFESWLYPLVIIVSVPLGAVGGIVGLRLLGLYLNLIGGRPQALDVLTMLGFVILIGTVVNNAILLVHQSLNLMRVEQMNSVDAILEAIRTRIRPIFMTTLTTVFGLAPLVFFPGAGSELYRGIGSVILGGLVVSTVFTLVMIPALFSLVIDLKVWVGNTFSAREPEASAAIVPGVPSVARSSIS